MSIFTVARRIEIDAGHRIMTHGSKCRHIHGHRYAIEAVCGAACGRLHEAGEQSAMVLDFGFLKEEMIRLIGACCDHGFIATIDDTELLEMFAPRGADFRSWHRGLRQEVVERGLALTMDTRLCTKLYVVPFIPTAEMLVQHWFHFLAPAVRERSLGVASLLKVTVWETPNCWAEFQRDSQ